MTSYFITATGTDIGKTHTIAGLIRAGRELKRDFAAIKPILTGYDNETAPKSDPAVLLNAMGRPNNPRNIATISPWRFTAPLSPDMAAAREGKHIILKDVVTFCEAAIAAAPGTLLIEGIGGVAVPLNEENIVSDWISALNIPAILVAGTYLGTLSHIITAGALLSAQGIQIAAIVLNESENAPVLGEEIAATLERFAACPIHIIPRSFDDGSFKKLAASL
ncbi:MAG TPA: dethiobiotin synthase [Acidocella sp.]|nr:dethiobiotin synthase [Acidocella sp.]